MLELIILGTANAIPDEDHENTHMAIRGEERMLLIDCVSNPILRLPQAGLEFDQLTDLILTHFHPDHVSGVPLLLMDMWLMGRRKPLNIYGLHHTLDRVENLMGLYDWSNWPNFFPVAFHRLPSQNKTIVMESKEFRVYASPVRHLLPTIGVRIEFPQIGKAMAYSCDTEPCPQVIELAQDVDLLLHEATGATTGHTSPAQAGEVARRANARRLLLIHYSRDQKAQDLAAQAREKFSGEVDVARDFMRIEFG